tara:strand:+ start:894 stop:1778 length:885 start_codon:yes stop_codon:yes gene_type:complete
MFDQITIIGCGLIGSSVFKALKKKSSIKKIITFDNNKSVMEVIKKNNLSDEIVSSPAEAVKNSDLVLISTPSSSFSSVIKEIKESLKNRSILTDTLSVKKEPKLKLDDINWIPSHPVAGTEKSGPTAGKENLFENRWTILTPGTNVKESDIKKVSLFWETMGSKVKIMSAEEHDKILSITSHLPHVVAYNIVKTVMGYDEKIQNDIITYSAGGLRDFTRIAASDPTMWRDIFIDNSDLIIQAIDKFSKNLDEFKKVITDKDSKKLLEIFNKSKELRKSIIKAGQETDKPDFGRK